MDQFYQDLAGRIRAAAASDMQKILEDVGDERIYAAALVTDSDCVTLFLAVNTLEYLEAESGLESEEKWYPDEWGYSDGNDSELGKLSRFLFEHQENIESGPDEDQDEEWPPFFEAVTSALGQLKKEKVFGPCSEEVICFASISDDDRAEAVEDKSAELLNAPGLLEGFFERYQ